MNDGVREAEAAVRSCYSTWGHSYYDEYYGSGAPYPPVHADLLRRLLASADARTVLDAGCGPASFLRDLPDDVQGYGFDLTPEMVDAGREILEAQGVPGSRLWVGSVVDAQAFRHPSGHPDRFDAAVCVGVLPHVPAEADAAVITNLRDAVAPGGLVAIEARNELFALFTLNRYSRDLFLERLIPTDRLRAAAGDDDDVDAVLEQVERMFRTDLPPVRKGKADEPGYDEVLSRTHNPFELRAAVEAAGLVDVRVLFYHFHAAPPLATDAARTATRGASLEMEEDPEDWRGYFMASAFVVVGRRV